VPPTNLMARRGRNKATVPLICQSQLDSMISRFRALEPSTMLIVLASTVEFSTSGMIVHCRSARHRKVVFPNQHNASQDRVKKCLGLLIHQHPFHNTASNSDFSSSTFLSYHTPVCQIHPSSQHHSQHTASIPDLSQNTPSCFEKGPMSIAHLPHKSLYCSKDKLPTASANNQLYTRRESRCLSPRSLHHHHPAE